MSSRVIFLLASQHTYSFDNASKKAVFPVLFFLFLFTFPYSTRSQEHANSPGLIADLAFETCPFMQKNAYRRPDHISPESDLSPDGAMGAANRKWDSIRQGKWYIEEQRYGFDAIAAGLANNDTVAINRGLRIFSWGFRQQQADGSLDCPDAFHSTSFFVEATIPLAWYTLSGTTISWQRKKKKKYCPKCCKKTLPG